MGTSKSKTFQAEPEKVWRAVVKIVNGAGYTIKETDTAAKQIVYQASGGGWAFTQLVKVSVVGVDEDETLVTVRAAAAGQSTIGEGGQQQKLISFIFKQLKEQFPLAANQQTVANAPGTSGCLGGVLILAVLVLAVFTLVAG